MKTILLPMVNHKAMGSALETALMLARRHDCYIEGCALRSRIDSVAIAYWAIPLGGRVLGDIENVSEAREKFESFMQISGVPRATKGMRSLSFGWLNQDLESGKCVGSYGRVFDVIVMARAGLDTGGIYANAIESGLFESGRPIILSPPSSPQEIGTNVLIVWGGSAEQARAVSGSMPLLARADRVTVLSVRAKSAFMG
ncbi:MAG: universal stress protein, partial [Bradyrhizobium sp.]